MSGKEVCYI